MKTILDHIGNTPVVEIRHICQTPGVKVLAKLEYMNPGGSIKDRAAAYMIAEAEKSGELTKDKVVLEATSGNTGIGLALVCSVKGYRLMLAMSERASEERKIILRARGAEILLTPGHLGTDGAIEEVYRLGREYPDKYFITDQFNNDANWKAHYYGTAEEIWRQTDGGVDVVVSTLGTSGTAMGLSRRLKEFNPDVRVVGVEPFLGHKIQGLKNMKESYQPEIFKRDILDAKPNIEDETAFEMTRRLAREEGLFVGMSSGAAMAVACEEAEKLGKGVVVVIFPDSGERYLSTNLFTVQDTVDLRLFNTITREKAIFEPLVPGKVSMYSCGPTACGRMGLGQCRRMVFADVLSRYLTYRGYEVNHIVNITDFDDKTIDGAEKAGLWLRDFTKTHIDQFKQDLAVLRVRPANAYPLTSDTLPEMTALAEKLVDSGAAYEKLRSVYFDISSLSEYGTLSNVDTDKIRLGSTVDLDEYEKDNPRDFTLLKRARLKELKKGLYMKTRWGNVRPSLHIQCAAMSQKYLGEQFDIHTGSRDLMFPHHENEIAIARAASGKAPARYWIHCESVLAADSEDHWKAAQVTLEDAENMGFSGREVRYWLLAAHYRKAVSFSRERVETAVAALERLDNCVCTLSALKKKDAGVGETAEETSQQAFDQLLYDIRQGFVDAMDDDLNLSAALASVFKNVKTVNAMIGEGTLDAGRAKKVLDAFAGIDSVLKIFDFAPSDQAESPEIKTLIEKREQARQNKDWALADRIRDELRGVGVEVVDGKIG
ncbi:MAG: cysteine--tRNA ligase [Thermodesulfobacteriota bacterium]|nr:cysteine--tRNA ligase [Thermodesulfobacteriota bacterium]